MKKFILLLSACFMLSTISAQDSIPSFKKDSLAYIMNQADSQQKKIQDEIFQNTLKQNEQSLDSFMKELKERDRKERQQMYLRIGLGILFFIVLVIGLMRRRKKKTV